MACLYKNTSSFTEFGPDFLISSVYSLITSANFWPSDAEGMFFYRTLKVTWFFSYRQKR